MKLMPYTYIYIYKYVCACVCVKYQSISKYLCPSVSSSAHVVYQYVDVEMKNRIHQDHLKREGKPLNGVSSRNIPWVKKLVKSYILFCCHHSMEGWRGDRSIYAMHLAAQLEFQVPLRPKCSE